MDATFTFTVNGQSRTVTTEPQRPMLEVLREELQLTGTKYGCGESSCGACTVIMDGRAVRTCTMPVASAQGKTITTIEGLANGEKLHPVQEAFVAEGAFQCGYCTSGMIMATVALLNQVPNPTDGQILAALDGNLCRCCGYTKILKAVRRAAGQAGR